MSKNYTQYTVEDIAEYFQHFAEVEPGENSPLYYAISKGIVNEPELLKLAQQTRYGQPMANMILGSTHYLLLQNPDQELAKYYPSITGKIEKTDDHLVPLFKDFCLKNKDEIEQLLTTKLVQTNAINRCAYLMPMFNLIAQENDNKPLALIDIGTSASLNLYVDDYQYEYLIGDTKKSFGPVDSHIKVRSEIRQDLFPTFGEMARIERRIGIDQNPLDLTQDENALWLKSLIWADHLDRFQRMSAAVQMVQDKPKAELLKGSSIDDFKGVVKGINEDMTLVIFHTHVLYQFSEEARQDFWNWLDELGQERDFYYIGAEGFQSWRAKFDTKDVSVSKTTYKNGEKQSKLIALTNGHANWIEWQGF